MTQPEGDLVPVESSVESAGRPCVAVAVLPDSQSMTRYRPAAYLQLGSWLASRAQALGLDLALHVGDVVDSGAEDVEQYVVAARAHQMLAEAGVPLLVAPGNHDYDDLLMQSRDAHLFNAHLGWDAVHDQEWFGGSQEEGSAENSFALIDAAAGPVLAMVLEFGPRESVIDWAHEVLTTHSDRAAFISTHCYLDPDAERTSHRSRWHPRSHQGAADGLDGAEIWKFLLRHHDNVVAIFSGHQIPGIVSHRVDLTDGGSGILQTFQNWQCAPPHLSACIRLLRWFPESGQVTMQVINTATGREEHQDGYFVDVTIGPSAVHTRWPAVPIPVDYWPSGRPPG